MRILNFILLYSSLSIFVCSKLTLFVNFDLKMTTNNIEAETLRHHVIYQKTLFIYIITISNYQDILTSRKFSSFAISVSIF